MKVALCYAVTAQPGKAEVVLESLKGLSEAVRSAPGFLKFELMQSQTDPSRFVLIEDWQSPEHHQAAFENLPQDLLQTFASSLTEDIRAEYYDYRVVIAET